MATLFLCEQSHETGAKYRNRIGALTLAMSRSATKLTSHKMEASRDAIVKTGAKREIRTLTECLEGIRATITPVSH